MKKITLIILAIIFCIQDLSAQQLYKLCFNGCGSNPSGANYQGIRTIESADKNGTITLFERYGNSLSVEYLIIKIDSLGNQIWNKKFSIQYSVQSNDTMIQMDLSGIDMISSKQDYILCSFKDSIRRDSMNVLIYAERAIHLTKIDDSGNIIWSNDYFTAVSSTPQKIITDPNDNSIYCFSSGSQQYLSKFDENGNLLWSKEFTGITFNTGSLNLTMVNDRIYISATKPNIFSVTQTDTSGNIQWSKDFSSTSSVALISTIKINNKLAIAFTEYISSTYKRPGVLQIDENANIISAKTFGSDSTFETTNFFPYSENRFLLFTFSAVSNGSWPPGSFQTTDFWAIDSTNNFSDHKQLMYYNYSPSTHSGGGDYPVDFFKNERGFIALINSWTNVWSGIIAASPLIFQMDSIGNGCYYSPSNLNTNSVNNITINLSDNNVTNINSTMISEENYITSQTIAIDVHVRCVTSVGLNDSELDNTYISIQPNPFSSSTVFIAKGFNSRNNTLKIFNSLGANVRTEKITAEETIIDRASLATGVYFYQFMHDNEIISTGKFVVE